MQARTFAGYVRVSRQGEREDDKFRSPTFQRDTIKAFARREGLALELYPDEIDVSGSRVKRPTLDAIIEGIERGELAGIVVAKLDRLSRLRPTDRLALFERIEGAGGVVLSASESNDTSTPEGRFVREIFFALARMELEKKADGFAQAKRNAIASRIAVAPVAPFGYRHNERHGLDVVEEDAELVVELFTMRAGGASYGECLAHFERMTGRSSYRETIKGMLANRTYLGELRYGRVEELVNESGAPAIVDAELFEDVQTVNRERSAANGKRTGGRPVSLLAGIAKCEGCGVGLVRSTNGRRRAVSYKCPNDTRHCPARASIGADELDRHVVDRVLEWAGPAADELVEVELGTAGDRAGAELRLADAEARLEAWAADLELEESEPAAYRRGLDARRARVELRRAELDAYGAASELESVRGTIREALTSDDYSVDERRRLLGIALAGVIVRRTPRRGAPAVERADVVLATTASTVAEDAPVLVQ